MDRARYDVARPGTPASDNGPGSSLEPRPFGRTGTDAAADRYQQGASKYDHKPRITGHALSRPGHPDVLNGCAKVGPIGTVPGDPRAGATALPTGHARRSPQPVRAAHGVELQRPFLTAAPAALHSAAFRATCSRFCRASRSRWLSPVTCQSGTTGGPPPRIPRRDTERRPTAGPRSTT
jgi:hypothetical protein